MSGAKPGSFLPAVPGSKSRESANPMPSKRPMPHPVAPAKHAPRTPRSMKKGGDPLSSDPGRRPSQIAPLAKGVGAKPSTPTAKGVLPGLSSRPHS